MLIRDLTITALLLLLTSGFMTLSVRIAMADGYVDPVLDQQPEGFEYFSRPVTCLGVPAANDTLLWTAITPEGHLSNGETIFVQMIGKDFEPVYARVRHLLDGYLPCVEYTISKDSISYRWQMFGSGTTYGRTFRRYDLVQVTATNEGTTQLRATAAVGIRHGGTLKEVPRLKLKNPYVYDDRETWRIDSGKVSRGGKTIYLYQDSPGLDRFVAAGEPYTGEYTGRDQVILWDTVTGIVAYNADLAPGEQVSWSFLYPYHAISKDEQAFLDEVSRYDWDRELEKFHRYWATQFKDAGRIMIPERKIQDLAYASLAKMLLARSREVVPAVMRTMEVQKINAFTYEFFPANDSPYFDAAYLHWGLFEKARQNQVARKAILAEKNGPFMAGGVWEAYGEALWITHRYLEITGDRQTAEKLYPHVVATVSRMSERASKDPLGLLPEHEYDDGEVGKGHFLGHNLWWSAGLRHATALAKELGHDEDASRFAGISKQFDNALDNALKTVGSNYGYIAARVEGEGQLWGVLTCAWPARPLKPHHPLVGPTLEKAKERSAEGIVMYKEQIHDYAGLDMVGARILRGEAAEALRYLYDTAVHTSNTHDGFECSLIPWTNRDPGLNFTPHTWFAAKLCLVIRDMMLYEDGDSLRVFPVISPAWIKAGETVRFENMPTRWGRVSASLEFRNDGVVIRLDPQWRAGEAPQRVTFELPEFAKPIGKTPRTVALNPRGGTVEIRWQLSETPPLSYESRAKAFIEEYAKHIPPEVKQEKRFLDLTPVPHRSRDQRVKLREARGLAASCPVTASSTLAWEAGNCLPYQVADNPDRRIIDSEWLAARPPEPDKPEWLQIDLREVYSLGSVEVTLAGNTKQAMEIELSKDGHEYQTILGSREPYVWQRKTIARTDPTPARFVRLTFHAFEGASRPAVQSVRVYP